MTVNQCFTSYHCTCGECPNAQYDIADDRYGFGIAVDMGLEKISCKECCYNTGKCEDCMFNGTDECTKGERTMREILFRGKRKDNGEWIYGVPITDEATNDAYIITSTAGASLKSEINNMCATGFRIIRNTVGQYTGLTDKNGTRIFEGDIISCDYFIGTVSFYNGRWCASKMGKLPEDLYELVNLEVIGNIHDNGHPF